MYVQRTRRRKLSEGSTSPQRSSSSSSSEGSCAVMGSEVMLRPRLPPTTGVRAYNSFQVERKKEGDVDGEKFVEERMRQLGVLDAKAGLERCLADKLEQTMEQDRLIGALNRCKTARRRPLVERVTSVTDEITNIIRPSIATGIDGFKVYKVDILMGLFTKNVDHVTDGRQVTIRGCMPSGAKLSKEVSVEFPVSVDITRLSVSFNAGVFKLTAPFANRMHQGRSTLSLDTSLDTLDSTPMTSPNSACSSSSDCSASQRPLGDTSINSQRPLDESGFCEDDDSLANEEQDMKSIQK